MQKVAQLAKCSSAWIDDGLSGAFSPVLCWTIDDFIIVARDLLLRERYGALGAVLCLSVPDGLGSGTAETPSWIFFWLEGDDGLSTGLSLAAS
jgi:hypothetical protein